MLNACHVAGCASPVAPADAGVPYASADGDRRHPGHGRGEGQGRALLHGAASLQCQYPKLYYTPFTQSKNDLDHCY